MGLQALGSFLFLLFLSYQLDCKSLKARSGEVGKVPVAVVNNATVAASHAKDFTANQGSGSGYSADEFEEDASGEESSGNDDEEYNDRTQIAGSGMNSQFSKMQQTQQQSQFRGPSVDQLLNGGQASLYGLGMQGFNNYGQGMNFPGGPQAPGNPYQQQQQYGMVSNPMAFGQGPFQQYMQPIGPYGQADATSSNSMPSYGAQQTSYTAQQGQTGSSGGCKPSCDASCAPACTDSCCKTPPVELPPEAKKVRWHERPKYRPGPPVPPPPLEPAPVYDLQCPAPCTQACAPSCLPSCCAANFPPPPPPPPMMYYPQPVYAQMMPMMMPQQSIPYGCSPSCQPQSCTQYCPSHCCARYT